MGLKLKCNKCGFLLGHEVQNPGVIIVEPCEGCVQQTEDTVTYAAGEKSGFAGLATSPDMVGEFLPKLTDRINMARQQEDGADDGNDWRPVKER